MQLRKELLDTKTRLTHESQETQQKLERFDAELQTLQDEFQNVELQKHFIGQRAVKENEEIKNFEDRLSVYTSLAATSLPVE